MAMAQTPLDDPCTVSQSRNYCNLQTSSLPDTLLLHWSACGGICRLHTADSKVLQVDVLVLTSKRVAGVEAAALSHAHGRGRGFLRKCVSGREPANATGGACGRVAGERDPQGRKRKRSTVMAAGVTLEEPTRTLRLLLLAEPKSQIL